jgi:hypothetical protein
MARHEFDQVHVHPTALMVGADMGMDKTAMRELIHQVGERNPMLLVGGYNIDVAIIAMAAALRQEDYPTGDVDIFDRIQTMIEVYCAGGI